MTVLHTLRHTVRRPGPLAAAVACALAAVHVAPAAQQQPGTAFRTGTELVTVDVVVRDRSGAIVHGLTAGDFTVLEDGRPQRIETFAFHEIATDPRPARGVAEVFAGVQERLIAEVQQPAGTVPGRRCRGSGRRPTSRAADWSCSSSTSVPCSPSTCSAPWTTPAATPASAWRPPTSWRS